MWIPITWLGVLVLPLAIVASEVLPFAWFTPSRLPDVLVEAELAFLLFVWPVLLPGALTQANPEGGAWRDLRTLCAQIAVLAALTAPITALCARAAEIGLGSCLASQAYPAGIAVGVGLLAVCARHAGRNPTRLYYLALVVVSAALPLTGFVLREVGGRVDLSLAACSPFHAAMAGWLARGIVVAALLAASALCAVWPRRSSSSC